MKKLLHFIIGFLLFLWQLPQYIFFLFFDTVFAVKYKPYKRVKVAFKKGNGFEHKVEFIILNGRKGRNYPPSAMAITGSKVFVFKDPYDNNEDYLKKNIYGHEFGHCIQSKMFGPAYILIIGIPSLVYTFLNFRLVIKGKLTPEEYTEKMKNFYTEFTADDIASKYVMVE